MTPLAKQEVHAASHPFWAKPGVIRGIEDDVVRGFFDRHSGFKPKTSFAAKRFQIGLEHPHAGLVRKRPVARHADIDVQAEQETLAESRGGKASVSTFRDQWSPSYEKKQKTKKTSTT